MSKTFRHGAPKKRDWRGKYKKPKKNKKFAKPESARPYDDYRFSDD